MGATGATVATGATAATGARCLLLALLAASAAAHAQGNAGHADAGKAIASQGLPPAVAACASCHGAQGEGMAGFPPLAGQGADYLRSQLEAFADGSRGSPVMAPIAKGLKPQDRADVAAYFASLPSGIAAAPASPDPKDAGAWLALRGRMADGIPACASCHGPNGGGVGGHFPAIAKLDASYMQAQVDGWKSGSRGPGPLGLMAAVAKRLSAQDIEAVARHYAATAARQPQGGAAQ